MTHYGSDPFGRFPPEVRLNILISTGCKSSIARLIEASPIMLQQYLVHKKHIIRHVLASEFDEEMIQDAMAVILFPCLWSSGQKPLSKRRSKPIRSHIRTWSKFQLPNPVKDKDDHLMGQLNRLHSRLVFLIEDYITKATATFPAREYLCLPQIQQPSVEGHLIFRGVKVTTRFNFANLTFLERRRFVKAFLIYELLCKTSNIRHLPDRLLQRKVSNAEFEAVGCVHRYYCSLYGAIFAQCTDAKLICTSAWDPFDGGLRFPNTFYFDANAHASKVGLFYCKHGLEPDYATKFSSLGLDHLTNILLYDMARCDEREAVRVHLQDVWINDCQFEFWQWDILFMLLFETMQHYQNGCESLMYKQLALETRCRVLSSNPVKALRHKISQQRAWVFFDDGYFYPHGTTERPTFPPEWFLAEEPTQEFFRMFPSMAPHKSRLMAEALSSGSKNTSLCVFPNVQSFFCEQIKWGGGGRVGIIRQLRIFNASYPSTRW